MCLVDGLYIIRSGWVRGKGKGHFHWSYKIFYDPYIPPPLQASTDFFSSLPPPFPQKIGKKFYGRPLLPVHNPSQLIIQIMPTLYQTDLNQIYETQFLNFTDYYLYIQINGPFLFFLPFSANAYPEILC